MKLNRLFIRNLLIAAGVMLVLRIGLSLIDDDSLMGVPLPWLAKLLITVFIGLLAMALQTTVLWGLQPVDTRVRSVATVPRPLKMLVGFVIWFVAALVVLHLEFDYPVTTAIAASGAAAVVVGFALRTLFLDLFTGIAFSIDGEIAVGDYISIKMGSKSYFGRIEEINWRLTRINLGMEHAYLLISNSELGRHPVVNYNSPEGIAKRLDIKVQLRPGVRLDRAKRVLLGAAQKAARIHGMAAVPVPDVIVNDLDGDGIKYQVIVSFDPDKISPRVGMGILSEQVYEALERNFLTLPPHIVEMNRPTPEYERGKVPNPTDVISRVPIFSETLTVRQLQKLAEDVFQKTIQANEVVVAQGDEGDTMYIVIDGALAVKVKLPDGKEIEVAVFSAGDFFGEMSLLTGAQRTASVVALTEATVLEISKADFQVLFAAQPSLASRLSEALTDRQAGLDSADSDIDEEALKQRKQTMAAEMFGKISSFFDIRKAS